MGIELSGFAYDSAGNAVANGSAVNVYDRNTTTNARATTTTSGGAWNIDNGDVTVSSVYQMDVEVTVGSTKVRYKYDDQIMLTRVDVKDFVLRSGSSNQFVGTVVPATLTADRTYTLPNFTGNVLVGPNSSISSTDVLYLNDSSNAFMSKGITIKATEASEIISFKKDSGVAHGLTSILETDTFGFISMADSAHGGLRLVGITDTTNTDSNDAAVMIQGYMKATVDTSASNNASGCVAIVGREHDGSDTASSLAATENILVLKKGLGTTDTTHIFEGNGDLIIDGSSTTFDDYDDVALLTAWNGAVAKDNRYKVEFKNWVDEHKQTLEDLGIITPNEDGSFMYSVKNLNSLMVGAIRQLGTKVNKLEEQQALKGA
tara:strand:- start:782 stop:1906 length:1125 start_codon:yes stop_codon:yes gene_type:complete